MADRLSLRQRCSFPRETLEREEFRGGTRFTISIDTLGLIWTNIVARQAMLGVENGQVFLRRGSRPHPCLAGLGVDADPPQAHIFQTQVQFRQGKHTLVTQQETEFQKHFVKHGLCEYPSLFSTYFYLFLLLTFFYFFLLFSTS